jgi:arabinose-5-phosphate isomerase
MEKVSRSVRRSEQVSSTSSANEAEMAGLSNSYFDCALRTFEIESRAVRRTIESLDPSSFQRACEILLRIEGRVAVTGMGKSGHIARKLSSTLSSTGTPAMFLHPAEGAHGDIGMLKPGDAIVMLSKSGESDELFSLLPALLDRKIPIVAITAQPNSKLGNAARESGGVVLPIVVEEEACPNDLAPTASTTAALVLGDALAMALLEARKFTSIDFAKLHPAGALGRKLTLTARDLMVSGSSIPQVSPEADLGVVMDEITSKRLGCTAVTQSGKLLGIITDGDLRRYFQAHEQVTLRAVTAREIMVEDPRSITPETLAIDALRSMENDTPKVMQLVVLDTSGQLVGMLHLHDLVKAGIS